MIQIFFDDDDDLASSLANSLVYSPTAKYINNKRIINIQVANEWIITKRSCVIITSSRATVDGTECRWWMRTNGGVVTVLHKHDEIDDDDKLDLLMYRGAVASCALLLFNVSNRSDFASFYSYPFSYITAAEPNVTSTWPWSRASKKKVNEY